MCMQKRRRRVAKKSLCINNTFKGNELEGREREPRERGSRKEFISPDVLERRRIWKRAIDRQGGWVAGRFGCHLWPCPMHESKREGERINLGTDREGEKKGWADWKRERESSHLLQCLFWLVYFFLVVKKKRFFQKRGKRERRRQEMEMRRRRRKKKMKHGKGRFGNVVQMKLIPDSFTDSSVFLGSKEGDTISRSSLSRPSLSKSIRFLSNLVSLFFILLFLLFLHREKERREREYHQFSFFQTSSFDIHVDLQNLHLTRSFLRRNVVAKRR